MRGEHRDDTARLAPVLADEPIEVHNPRRKIRVMVLLFATAIILSAAASAYVATMIAYQQSTRHTDQRIATLERDLAQRRAERAEQDQQTQALLQQYRHTICTLAGQRSGPDIDQLRADFHCEPPPPTPSAPPSTRAPAGTPTTRPTPRATASLTGTGAPAPRPQPAPPPPDGSPTPPFCLPLVGCLPH